MSLTYTSIYHPGLSVDCVIFGFHDHQLKVLLLKMKQMDAWSLPGGFVRIEESVDDAALRVLHRRTGLENIFLKQFYLFGNLARNISGHAADLVARGVISPTQQAWFEQRFVTLGYYALVEYSKATPRPDDISERCEWVAIESLPALMLDHQEILQKALTTLRTQLHYLPIGHNLLPEKFTMPELQSLYEAILGFSLDRRNFQRKMLGYGILTRLDERKKGGAHKAPFLYSFDREAYEKALNNGLISAW